MTEIKPFVVASRARDPLTPSRCGPCMGRMKQKLEPNYEGETNTNSTVSKDNYLVLPSILSARRTEFGKAIRKQYDSHQIHLKRQDMREWVPKGDSTSNTITSVTKDNMLMEQKTVIDKKQAKKRKHGLPAEMLHLDNRPKN